jgi:LmbE family N-acetylglucosaminyl deacetylase
VRTLLLAPHSDDEILFAAYTIARDQPEVWIVARDPEPDVAIVRGNESIRAYERMHPSLTPPLVDYLGHHVEGHMDGDAVCDDLAKIRDETDGPIRVFASALESNGHREHAVVGIAAVEVFGRESVRWYLTYTRDKGRSTDGDEVAYEPGWISRKLRALACFQSQIDHPARRPWFYDLIDLREWYA